MYIVNYSTVNSSHIDFHFCRMAGSGKTEFCKKLSQFNNDIYRPYSINLDPACKETPYHAHIGMCMLVFSNRNVKYWSFGFHLLNRY